jgi:hypothetical protein
LARPCRAKAESFENLNLSLWNIKSLITRRKLMARKEANSNRTHANGRKSHAIPLKAESETFEKNLPKLLRTSLGKFVIINGQTVLGVRDDYQAALKLGYAKCGTEKPFFVEQIESPELTKRRSCILMARLECIK